MWICQKSVTTTATPSTTSSTAPSTTTSTTTKTSTSTLRTTTTTSTHQPFTTRPPFSTTPNPHHLPDPVRFYASLAGNIALSLLLMSILSLLLRNYCKKRQRRSRSSQLRRAANDLDFFSIAENDDEIEDVDETSPLIDEIDRALMKSDQNLAAKVSAANVPNDPQPSSSSATLPSTSSATLPSTERRKTDSPPTISPSTSPTLQCQILNNLIEKNEKKSKFETIKLNIFKK